MIVLPSVMGKLRRPGDIPADAVFYADFAGQNFYWGNGSKTFGSFTFTRAGSATYVDKTDGLIKSASGNIARFENGGLLIEDASTNLCVRSSEFTHASWTALSLTPVDNTVVSPDGTTNAAQVTLNLTTHFLYQTISVTASTNYNFSFWAKRGTAAELKYSIYNIPGGADIISATSYYAQTNASTWTRITVNFTTPVGCTSIRFYPLRNSGVLGTVFIWGAQLEAGRTATSYIPTTSAQITRAADLLTLDLSAAGITLPGGAAGYTVFMQYLAKGWLAANYPKPFYLDDGTTSNVVGNYHFSGGVLNQYVAAGGIANIDQTIASLGAVAVKYAGRYKNNDSYATANNGVGASDASCTIPAVTRFALGGASWAGCQVINQVIIYSSAKNNTDVKALTV